MSRLTDTSCKNATPKPDGKPNKLYDAGSGLYLLVKQNKKGISKYWRWDYLMNGQRNTWSCRSYPKVSLKEARIAHGEARELFEQGIDPNQHKRMVKLAQQSEDDLFETVAREWFEKFRHTWSESHAETIISRLERFLFPYIGKRKMPELKAPEVLMVLRRIESAGKLETARRVKQICGQVFRYGVATGRAELDPTYSLKGAIPPPISTSFAAITDAKEIGALLRAIDGFSGEFITLSALKLAPHVFLRPGELRQLEWSEVDFEEKTIIIPAEKMKMRSAHHVPLSNQALAILQGIHAYTQGARYVFHGLRSKSRPMSENTVNAALRRMGYSSDEMTGHGFRAMASTQLNQLGYNSDVIEKSLAHVPANRIRGIYNRAEYWADRVTMYQDWSDYLDSLKNGAVVIPIKSSA